ncbi:MAG: hypothetical protein Q7T71_14770 [Herbiconiux sp.]|nr:hypothetical protein [Herbiconiux sp.]
MTLHDPALDAQLDAQTRSTTGMTRRQFTTAAAWAAPVVAIAVGTPLAAASGSTPSISIARDSDVTFTGAGDPKEVTGTYGGTVSVLDLPVGEETGALTYTITIPAGVTVTPGTLPGGWVTVTSTATLLVFQGPSLSDANPTTTLPGLTFGGSIGGSDRINLQIEAANEGYQFAEDSLGWGDPA